MASVIRRSIACVVLCAGTMTVAVGTSLAINAGCLVCTNRFRALYPDQLPAFTTTCQSRAAAACTTCSPTDIFTQCRTAIYPYRPSWLDRILAPFV